MCGGLFENNDFGGFFTVLQFETSSFLPCCSRIPCVHLLPSSSPSGDLAWHVVVLLICFRTPGTVQLGPPGAQTVLPHRNDAHSEQAPLDDPRDVWASAMASWEVVLT